LPLIAAGHCRVIFLCGDVRDSVPKIGAALREPDRLDKRKIDTTY
jgi:hypothetical protein